MKSETIVTTDPVTGKYIWKFETPYIAMARGEIEGLMTVQLMHLEALKTAEGFRKERLLNIINLNYAEIDKRKADYEEMVRRWKASYD